LKETEEEFKERLDNETDIDKLKVELRLWRNQYKEADRLYQEQKEDLRNTGMGN
jgi:hypothetical protein